MGPDWSKFRGTRTLVRGGLNCVGLMYLLCVVTCMYTGQSNLQCDRCGERN